MGELARKVTAGEREFAGQLEWDFERLRQVPVVIGQKVYQPRDIVVSRSSTLWVGVRPPDKGGLAKRSLESIKKGLPGFQLERGTVRDEVLTELARRVKESSGGP